MLMGRRWRGTLPQYRGRRTKVHVQAVRAAEEGSLGDALELLHRAVTEAPDYASPYNNRAQVSSPSG